MRSVTFGIPQRRLDWLLDQYAGEIARRRSLAALAVIAVHYAAALRYAPDKAAFTDFDPFWEFVAGPINAGTFGPNEVDMTFGPEVKFVSIPEIMKLNRSPFDGL